MSRVVEFRRRVLDLPRLGIGVSTEYGAFRSPNALDVARLLLEQPQWASFLEIGVEVDKGLDDDARSWIKAKRACTYHFLDVNLDDERDVVDEAWLAKVRAIVAAARPAWMCGDAGLWHFGPRDRTSMLLLPPILVDDAASAIARGVAQLREAVALEVLPENPPGTAFVGDLHLLDFFARVVERADSGMLLDVAHLAMYQRLAGKDALHGLDSFPLDRVVEMHVAGGVERNTLGFEWIEDAHGTAVLDDTWRIFDFVAGRAPNLRAVVFECERNANDGVVDGFARIESRLGSV
jgi:uncharacterized protein (UPF0276 family)